jgi:branched-chain amino acid transport system ATP-binding protein
MISPEPLFQAFDVTKRYSGLTAVDKVSFRVDRGEIFGIAGPNGAGKTTLFDVVTGMVKLTTGRVEFAGRPIHSATVANITRMGVARTFQKPSVFDSETVLANAVVGAQFGALKRHWWDALRRDDHVWDRAVEELEFMGLGERLANLAGSLAVFDKKRLMIASALASEPQVLFLDEPFGGLTPGEIEELIILIRAANRRGITIVLIEHVMSALIALSGRVLIMNQGKTLIEGDPSSVMRDPEVVRVYLGKQGTENIERHLAEQSDSEGRAK